MSRVLTGSRRIYKCRLRIEYRSDEKKFTSYSEPFFIAKYYGGMTNRNVYAKFHQDAEPVSSAPVSIRFVDGVNFLARDDFYSTGAHKDMFVQLRMLHLGKEEDAAGKPLTPGLPDPAKANCGWSKETAAQFVLQHSWQALMAGPRAPVQTYGFVIDGKPAQRKVFELADDGSYSVHDSADYFSKQLLGSHNLEVYEQRTHRDYSCLSLAVVVVSTGSESQRQTIGEHLVDLSRRSDMDVAGLVDLIPLLGIINNTLTLSRVSELLTHPNLLVQVSACKLLGEYRFQGASAKLLAAYLGGEGNLKEAAAHGLLMSGDMTAVEVLLKKALSDTNSPEDLKGLASLIVHMAPKLAMKTIRELPLQSIFRAELIAAAQ